MFIQTDTHASATQSASTTTNVKLLQIREMCMIGLGANGARPHLLCIIGDMLITYELFTFDSG
jgi:hypothetical protein